MRVSEITFVDTCYSVKTYLALDSYELHAYEDGDYADFKVKKIYDPKTLLRLIGGHDYMILAGDGCLILRVFENFVG